MAENVSGLVKGVAKGYFLEILRAFKTSGYRVRSKLLDAQWLGVPQARQRIIFIGVRDDLKRDPVYPGAAPVPLLAPRRDPLARVRQAGDGVVSLVLPARRDPARRSASDRDLRRVRRR